MAMQIAQASAQYALGSVFVTSGGTEYVILIRFTTAYFIMCYKKTDGSFSEQDSGNAPGWGLAGSHFGAACDGTLIHVVYYSASDVISYITFNTSTDQWGTPEEVATSPDGVFAYDSADTSLDSDNKPHVVYVVQDKIKGKDSRWVKYKNKTGAVWSAEEDVSPTGQVQYGVCTCRHESDDRLAVAYYDAANAEMDFRTRSSAGIWDTAQSIGAAYSYPPSLAVDTNDNVYIALVDVSENLDVYKAGSGANPTISLDGSDLDADCYPPQIGANGDDMYVVYAESSVWDILLVAKKDGSWGSPETLQSHVSDSYFYTGIQNPTGSSDFDYVFLNQTDGYSYWDEYSFAAPPSYPFHRHTLKGTGPYSGRRGFDESTGHRRGFWP